MAQEKAKRRVDLLWTGGWDSTYRVLSLAKLDIEIHPHYIIYPYRKSAPNELAAMQRITELIRKAPLTKAELFDLTAVKYEDLPVYDDITAAFGVLKSRMTIGPQYAYLARYSRVVPNIELGIEKGGFADEAIGKYGKAVVRKEGDLEYICLDKDVTDEALYTVFGGFRLPILEVSKMDMYEYAKGTDELYIMNESWFCHYPVGGKPCGTCVPCRMTIHDGLSYRLPKSALRRHEFEEKHKDSKWYPKWKKFRRKVFKF